MLGTPYALDQLLIVDEVADDGFEGILHSN